VVCPGERRLSFVCDRPPVHSSSKHIGLNSIRLSACEIVQLFSLVFWTVRALHIFVFRLVINEIKTTLLGERDPRLWQDLGPYVFPWLQLRKLRNSPPLSWSTAFSWVTDFTSVQLHKICCYCIIVHFWGLNSPQRARVSSLTRFVYHTQRRATVGRTPMDEWSASRRNLYLTKHITHNRQTSMPLARFEPTISASERPQTHPLDRAATGSGNFACC
jgi:hypothetical protein